jgi:hypothetical protein
MQKISIMKCFVTTLYDIMGYKVKHKEKGVIE